MADHVNEGDGLKSDLLSLTFTSHRHVCQSVSRKAHKACETLQARAKVSWVKVAHDNMEDVQYVILDQCPMIRCCHSYCWPIVFVHTAGSKSRSADFHAKLIDKQMRM